MAKVRSFKGIIVFLIVIAVAGGGWFYWQSRQEKGPDFYTTRVNRGEIVQTVTAAGTIKPLLDVLVSSQISGYVTAWYKDFNDKVKKGDLLATLLPDSYEAAVKSARGDLANSKANYDLQKVTLTRDKELLSKNLLAQSDYDTQVAQVEEAAAQIQIKQAALDTAETNLSYCRIVSPLDGMIISRNVDVGNSVAASLSSPTLFEIGDDLTQMQIDASVAEADVGDVEDGQTVNFTVDAYPAQEFHGTVYQVRNAPQTQQNVVIYDVMIKVDNSDLKLKPGMTANVSIVVTRHPNVLRLANSGLRFRPPEDLAVVALASSAAAESAAASHQGESADQKRRDLKQLLLDAGYTRTGGRPSPELVARIRQLAIERGIEVPDRYLAGGRAIAAVKGPVYRSVYVLPGGDLQAEPREARVQIDITDGAETEILGGLKAGDVVITGINLPSSGATASNPFGR